jgi:hypothetical protein
METRATEKTGMRRVGRMQQAMAWKSLAEAVWRWVCGQVNDPVRHMLIVGLALLLTACSLPQVTAEERIFLNLSAEVLDSYRLPKQTWQGAPVGGLSGITYDRQRDQFYAISDDRSEFAPARFYTLKLGLDKTKSDRPKIQQISITAATTLTNEQGQPYPKGEIDPEGIALSPAGSLLISSEGIAKQQIPPFLNEFDRATGQWKRSLPIPQRYLPQFQDGKQVQGVGDNLGWEALSLNTSGGGGTAIEPFRLFAATESALVQDAEPAHPQQGQSRNRVLHYSLDPTRSLLVSEHLYPMDPPPEGAMFHGLTEILAIDQGGHFLSLERSFGQQGFSVKLFQFAMGGASDTSRIERFQGETLGLQPIQKKLLLDLTTLGIPLDNLEGMSFGPQLPDGHRSLVLISDDNFRAEQSTLVLLLRLQGL